VVIFINLMLTIGLTCKYPYISCNNIVERLVLIVLQMAGEGTAGFQDNTNLHRFVYFEVPYHLFNVVAFIVLMQW
jgi:hypothetical protein